MSMLRTNQLSPLDDSLIINVAEIASRREGITQLSNYSSLKNMVPSFADQVVLIKEYNTGTRTGGGLFVAVIGSASDNGGTICVPNGASGVYWQRIVDPQKVTPEMFGVVPGVSSYAATNVTRINTMLAAGLPVVFSDQVYYLNGRITSALNATVILGAGMGATNLHWVSSAAGAAGIYVTLEANARTGAFNIGGFTVWSDNANSSTSYAVSISGIKQLGTTADANGSYGIQYRKEVRGRVHDIQVTTANDDYIWARAFSFVSVMNFSAANLHGIGSYTEGTVSPIFIFFGGDGKMTDVHWDNVWAYFYNYFVLAPDYCEGLHITNFEMVHCNTGIYGDYLSGTSTVVQAGCGFAYPYLDNGHINAINVAIQALNCEQGKFSNLTLFVNPISTTDNVSVIYMKAPNRCAFNGVSVMGWGAANTKFNNKGIVLNAAVNCTVDNVHGWSLGSVVYLSGSANNNQIDNIVGYTCDNTIGTDGTASVNFIGSGVRGNGNTTSAIQAAIGTQNAVEPVMYGASGTVAIASLVAQAAASIAIAVPPGNFGAAPDFATLMFGGEGTFLARYIKSSSTATSLSFSVVNVSTSTTAAVTANYFVSCGAGAGRKQ